MHCHQDHRSNTSWDFLRGFSSPPRSPGQSHDQSFGFSRGHFLCQCSHLLFFHSRCYPFWNDSSGSYSSFFCSDLDSLGLSFPSSLLASVSFHRHRLLSRSFLLSFIFDLCFRLLLFLLLLPSVMSRFLCFFISSSLFFFFLFPFRSWWRKKKNNKKRMTRSCKSKEEADY